MPVRLALLAIWLRQPRARHALVGCGLAVGLILAIGTTVVINASRRHDVDAAKRELQNLSIALAEETDRSFQAAELVQVGLIRALRKWGIDSPELFRDRMASAAINRDLQDRIAGLPDINTLELIDWQGKVINRARAWPVPEIDVSRQDFFQALVANPACVWFIGAPTRSRLNGAWIITIGRAFTASDGQLVGIVAVAMDLPTLERRFSRIALGNNGSVSLFHQDGFLVARYPHLDDPIGTQYGTMPGFANLLAHLDGEVLEHTSLIDGRPRQVAAHGISNFPLFLTVASSTDEVLTGWRSQTLWLGGGCLLAELVLAAIVWLGVRQLRGQERLNGAYAAAIEAEAGRALAESELETAREREQREQDARQQAMRFNDALSNMLQGLLMFDGVDRVLVANRRFSELFGLPPCAVKPGMTLGELHDLLSTDSNVTEDDWEALRAWREDLIDRHGTASFTWELADGRVFRATHHATDDGWIATYEDITERRRADARLAYMARHDALTDLPNRVLLRERLEQELAFTDRGRQFALLFLDLDQFKAVNDTLGHVVGDALIQAVAQRLSDRCRDTAVVARLGGDEFAIILTDIRDPAEAITFAGRLIEMIEAPFEVGGHGVVIGTSVGITFAPQDGADPDVLLRNADLALHRSKMEGRGVFRLFQTKMDAEMQARRIMDLDLRRALREDQLELFYQPLIDLRTRSVAGFEALLRWRHPEKGLVPPGEFIRLAEEIGTIVPIGEWVVQRACTTAAAWQNAMKVSVNLSPAQFKSSNLVPMVAGALSVSGLAPERLELEITETVMLQDTEATLATLHELRALGVRIAMDDFGTGYSSLSYLHRFPFDRIKIDQSFVREIGPQQDCGAIVRAVIGLSRELGMSTTAEGVETRDQLRALVRAGCSTIQGYLFSRPVPEAAIADLMRNMPTVEELMAPERAQPATAPLTTPEYEAAK